MTPEEVDALDEKELQRQLLLVVHGWESAEWEEACGKPCRGVGGYEGQAVSPRGWHGKGPKHICYHAPWDSHNSVQDAWQSVVKVQERFPHLRFSLFSEMGQAFFTTRFLSTETWQCVAECYDKDVAVAIGKACLVATIAETQEAEETA